MAYGAWDPKGGWVEKLREYLTRRTMSRPKWTSNPDSWEEGFNLGIAGETTANVRERFESEIDSRVDIGDETIIIFEVGSNDAGHLQKRFRVEKDKFRENIEWLIEKSRVYTKKIIFIGLLPVDDIHTNPVPWGKKEKECYKNFDAQYYNSLLRMICQTQKVMFIDMFEEFRKLNYKKLLYDGCTQTPRDMN